MDRFALLGQPVAHSPSPQIHQAFARALGLSLSYGIVQNHHGSLTVCSEPGVGTTFRVTLPVRHHAVAGAA